MILDELFKDKELTEDHKISIEKYTALLHLTLNSGKLTSLKNFPKLEKLSIVRKFYKFLAWT